ncbi:MAG TPA: hypothetical protein DCG54_09595 [Anaerolineae bacterium]|jgi:site-specific recombinase XerD|nr:hypothetical protein [Anaerolineae bacterium]
MNQPTAIETPIQTAREITLGDAHDAFLDEELIGASAETMRWYKCRLGLFIRAIGPDLKLSDLTKRHLIDWWRALEARTQADPPTLTPDTMHGYVRAARKILSWLYDSHLIVDDLLKYVQLPTLPERQRKGVRDDVVISIIEATAGNLRDRAIILFMESTGARRGGVSSLRLDDLNTTASPPYNRRATVHEKGKKAREVFMSLAAFEALVAYLAIRPKSKSDFVFLDQRPQRQNNGLKPGAINQMIARYKRALGITGTCSPHQWRHRFCRRLLKRRLPLSTAQQLLGHKNINVTASIYGNLLVDELQEAFDATYAPPDSQD